MGQRGRPLFQRGTAWSAADRFPLRKSAQAALSPIVVRGAPGRAALKGSDAWTKISYTVIYSAGADSLFIEWVGRFGKSRYWERAQRPRFDRRESLLLAGAGAAVLIP